VNCAVLSGLTFCTAQNGVKAEVAPGVIPTNVDATTALTYSSSLANPGVFTTPNATGCAAAYKNYLCRTAFPYCGQTAACQTSCYDATIECGLTPAEKALYDCTQGLVSCVDPNSSASSIAVAFAVTLFAVVLAL
jgi:hypothetical protein